MADNLPDPFEYMLDRSSDMSLAAFDEFKMMTVVPKSLKWIMSESKIECDKSSCLKIRSVPYYHRPRVSTISNAARGSA